MYVFMYVVGLHNIKSLSYSHDQMRLKALDLEQRLANYGSQAKSHLLPVVYEPQAKNGF